MKFMTIFFYLGGPSSLPGSLKLMVGWKTRSAECGVWKMGSMESEECGKCRVWKVRSVENAEYGKCGVWKMRSMENAECVEMHKR